MCIVVENNAQGAKNPLVVGHGTTDGTDVNHRVEAIKQAFLGIAMVLPSAANVVRIDQFHSFDQRPSFGSQRRDFIRLKHASNDEIAIASKNV
jgi:hypothetical protein